LVDGADPLESLEELGELEELVANASAGELGELLANASAGEFGRLVNITEAAELIQANASGPGPSEGGVEASPPAPFTSPEEIEQLAELLFQDIQQAALDAAASLMQSAANAVVEQGPEVLRSSFLAEPSGPVNGSLSGRAGLALGLQLQTAQDGGGSAITAPRAVAELCTPLPPGAVPPDALDAGLANSSLPPAIFNLSGEGPLGRGCSVLDVPGDAWVPFEGSRAGGAVAAADEWLSISASQAFGGVNASLWPLRRLAEDGTLVLENGTQILRDGTVMEPVGPPPPTVEVAPPAPTIEDLEAELEAGNQTTLTTNFFCGVQGLDESGKGCRTVTPATGLIQAIYINVVLGVLCFLGFGLLRGWVKVYRARLLSPATSVKPKPLPVGGVRQLWSWIVPVLSQSEIEMLESAGMDAVMLCRFLMFCAQLFVPSAILFCAVLLPANNASNEYRCQTPRPASEDSFLRLSMDNACERSQLMWLHAVCVYLFCGWGAFLLYQHYVAFAGLRHFHMSCYSPYNSWQARNIPSARSESESKQRKERRGGASQLSSKASEERGLRSKFAAAEKTPRRNSVGSEGVRSGDALLTSDMENVPLDRDTSRPTSQTMPEKEPSASAAAEGSLESLGSANMRSLFMQVFHPKRFVDSQGAVPDELRHFADFQRDYAKGYRASASDMKANLAGQRYISPRTQRMMQERYQSELAGNDPAGFVTPSPYGVPIPQEAIDEFMMSDAQSKEKAASGGGNRSFRDSIDESLGGQDSPSMAVQKWWEFRETGNDEQRQMIMVKPSVRHIKWVNAEVGNRYVSVGAENYAVLVMDVPHKNEVTSNDGPFESIFTPRTGFSKMKQTVLGRKKSLDTNASASGEDLPVSSRVITVSQHIRKGSHDDKKKDIFSPGSAIYETPRVDQGRRAGSARTQAGEDAEGDIAAEAFKGLFPEDFKEVVIAKDFRPVTRALYRWDNAAKKLEGIYARELLTGKKLMTKTGFMGLRGERVEAAKVWEKRVRQCQEKIKEARRAAIQGPPAPSRIILFNSQEAAAVSAQSTLFPIDGSMFHVLRAPGPDDIYWPTLMMTRGERTFRKALMFPLIAFIMLLPSGILAGALSIIQLALCGGDPSRGIESKLNWEAYCKDYPEGERPLWVTLFQKVLLTWLPPVLLMLWQIVLMRVLYYIAAAEGRNIALSMIDRRIISLYFYWDFFNVFLGGVIGSAGISLLVQNFSEVDINKVLILFGRAIMSNSNFFISYVSLRALLMIPFKLLFPHPAVLCWTLRNLLSKTYCCATRCNLTFRDKYVIWAPKSFMYGKESGIFLLIAMMGAIYAVSAPLILVFAAIYFSFAFVVFKHHLLYVYGRAYESGGIYWPILFTRMVILLISMACLTGVQMVIKHALWPAIALLPAPFLLLYFMSSCNKQFHNQVNYVPLEIAKAMPKADVPRELYVAPELRKESAGWHPESGKAWQGYGVPMWTL
jgi:DNA-directed RNA polymerase III subunit RPC2